MAINYRSKQQTISQASSDIVLLTPGAGIDTIIVNSVVCKFQTGSVLTGVELKIAKNDGSGLTKSFFQADFGDLDSGADYPANKAAECLTAPIVLEDGDELIANIEGGSFTYFIQFAERTTAAATGDIENLSNVSADSPSNNDVLIFNSASGQYEPGSVSAAGTGSITGTNGLTEDAPNRFMKRLDLLDDIANDAADYLATSPNTIFLVQPSGNGSVKKITFEDIMAAIVQSGAQTLIDAGYGTSTTYTADGSSTLGDLDGDGSVTTSDLLQFLVQFGSILDEVTASFIQSFVIFQASPGAGQGQTVLQNNGTAYVMPLGTLTGNYVIDTTGSQDVTVNTTAGSVTFEENQTDFAGQGAFKIRLENNPDDPAIEVLSKEDGTVVEIIIRLVSLNGVGGTIDSTEIVLHNGTYPSSSVFVDAGFANVKTYTQAHFSELNNEDAKGYQVSFKARRLSSNSQVPAVRFNNMKIKFLKE
jgi:hypothetical protein